MLEYFSSSSTRLLLSFLEIERADCKWVTLSCAYKILELH